MPCPFLVPNITGLMVAWAIWGHACSLVVIATEIHSRGHPSRRWAHAHSMRQFPWRHVSTHWRCCWAVPTNGGDVGREYRRARAHAFPAKPMCIVCFGFSSDYSEHSYVCVVEENLRTQLCVVEENVRSHHRKMLTCKMPSCSPLKDGKQTEHLDASGPFRYISPCSVYMLVCGARVITWNRSTA